MNRKLITAVFLFGLVSPLSFAENASMVDMLYKIDSLQKELSLLRGQIEELQYEVEKLKQKQRDQYIDVDRRLQQLTRPSDENSQSSLVEPPPLDLGESKTDLPSSTVENPAIPDLNEASSQENQTAIGLDRPATPSVGNEKDMYEKAFDFIKQKNYKQAEIELTQFVATYPQGELAPNAYYWLGEMQLLSPDLLAAKASFEKVINQFPHHHKVPDAMYKLGVVYHQLGDKGSAQKQLDELLTTFPGTTAANLARQYLQDMN